MGTLSESVELIQQENLPQVERPPGVTSLPALRINSHCLPACDPGIEAEISFDLPPGAACKDIIELANQEALLRTGGELISFENMAQINWSEPTNSEKILHIVQHSKGYITKFGAQYIHSLKPLPLETGAAYLALLYTELQTTELKKAEFKKSEFNSVALYVVSSSCFLCGDTLISFKNNGMNFEQYRGEKEALLLSTF